MARRAKISDSPVWERWYVLASPEDRAGFEMMIVYAEELSNKKGKDFFPVKHRQRPSRHRQWSCFVKAARICLESEVDFNLYVRAQIEGLYDKFNRIFPNQLLGDGAIKRFLAYAEKHNRDVVTEVVTEIYDPAYYESILEQAKSRAVQAGKEFDEDAFIEHGYHMGLLPEEFYAARKREDDSG